jgi:hypothetical protein
MQGNKLGSVARPSKHRGCPVLGPPCRSSGQARCDLRPDVHVKTSLQLPQPVVIYMRPVSLQFPVTSQFQSSRGKS